MVNRQNLNKSSQFFSEKINWCNKALNIFYEKSKEELTLPHKKALLFGTCRVSRRLCLYLYSSGAEIELVYEQGKKFLENTINYIKEIGEDLSPDENMEQYIDCLWLLSFCYFFNLPEKDVELIAKHISFSGSDWLIDRLVAASIPSHPIALGKFKFPEVYKPLVEALSYNQTSESRCEKIQAFLRSYYSLLKNYDITWYDSHKEEDPEYCIYPGYWIFELGALAADIGWDDTAYRNHEMYPKDLVDWKFAQRPDYRKSKI